MSERNGFLRYCATIAIAAFVLAPVQARGQRAELEKIIQRRVLPNGLEVIVVENHGVPLATVEIDVKNGSFTQTPNTRVWLTCMSICSSRRIKDTRSRTSSGI